MPRLVGEEQFEECEVALARPGGDRARRVVHRAQRQVDSETARDLVREIERGRATGVECVECQQSPATCERGARACAARHLRIGVGAVGRERIEIDAAMSRFARAAQDRVLFDQRTHASIGECPQVLTDGGGDVHAREQRACPRRALREPGHAERSVERPQVPPVGRRRITTAERAKHPARGAIEGIVCARRAEADSVDEDEQQ